MKSLKLALCLLFATPIAYSQETVTTAGGEATGSGTVIGQVVDATPQAAMGSVSQGVQQLMK